MAFVTFMASPAGRAIRVVVGLGLLVGAFALGGTGGIILGAVSLAPILTGITGYCPICSLSSSACAWEAPTA